MYRLKVHVSTVFWMAWGGLFRKSCQLKDVHEEMIVISSSLWRKPPPEFPLPAFSFNALTKKSMSPSIPVFAYGKKTVLKIWKHKLIPKRRESSGGVNLDAAPLMSCLKLLIHMEFSPSDIRGVWVAKHSSATQIPPIYSSNHPKNLCYVVIIKNNYGPTLSSSWLKSLGTARGKVSPQDKWGRLSSKSKSKMVQSLNPNIRVWAKGVALTNSPLLLLLCHVYTP